MATSNAPDIAEQPFTSLADLVAAHARRRPRHVALTCGDRSIDYAELDAGADRVAAALQRDGVHAGDAIAICATNSIEYALAFVGGLRAGAAVAPLPQSTAPAALAAMIGDTGARHLFVDAGVAATLEPVRGAIAARAIALDDTGAGTALRDWLGAGDAKPAAVAIDPEAPFNIIYSSGTTGTPKGIVQPHGMRWTQIERSAALRLRSRGRHARFHAAVLQHHAGLVPPDARPRRHA